MEDYVRASILKNFYDFVLEYGGDADELLKLANIDKKVVGKSDKYISYPGFIGLLEIVEEEFNISRAGLHLGLAQNYRMLGPVAFLIMASEDLREAIYNAKSYLPQFSSAFSFDIVNHDQAELIFDFSKQIYRESVHAVEHVVAATVQILRTVSDGRCIPSAITFRHERPTDGTDYEALLGCEVQFAQNRDALAIDVGFLDIPITTADSELKYLVSSYLAMCGAKQLLSHPQQTAFITKVFQVVSELLPAGRATRSVVADALKLHERSLHRRLTEYGQTFEAIVETVRRDKVQGLLAQQQLTMLEISELLGYRDQSSFNRAFKRWFGITPRQHANRRGSSRDGR